MDPACCLVMDPGWFMLDPLEVIFLAGHTHNVRRMLGDKFWEGQCKKTTAKWLVYCSTTRATKAWTLATGIEGSTAYVLVQILRMQAPGREHRPENMGGGLWAYDWILGTRYPIKVKLTEGVGQGPRYPTVINPHLVAPFKKIKVDMYMSGTKYCG
jgi:hypothetical protein